MNYTPDLERLSMDEYKSLLKQQNLLPSRRLLLHDIDENFAFFKRRGIYNVAQLKTGLSSPAKIADIVVESGIPEDYLVILKREIGSMVQKPVPLSSFPDIDPSQVEKLENAGLKTSKEYWESKQDLSDELFCLCDLVRINGVGPIAARVFYEAGYRSVTDVAGADAAVLLAKITEVNEVKCYYKAKLGLKDMQFCINFASLLNKYTD